MPHRSSPGRRERRRTETLDQVARAAVALFEAQGYAATTMEQIAAASDVAKGTLYNHFPAKEAVLAHAMHLSLADDTVRLHSLLQQPGPFEAKLRHLFAESAQWLHAHRDWLLPYFRHRFLHIDSGPAAPGAAPTDLAGLFAALISAAQREGVVRGDLGADHLAALLHHLYFGALMRWLTVAGRDLSDEFAAAIDLFLRGAGTGTGTGTGTAAAVAATPSARRKRTS